MWCTVLWREHGAVQISGLFRSTPKSPLGTRSYEQTNSAQIIIEPSCCWSFWQLSRVMSSSVATSTCTSLPGNCLLHDHLVDYCRWHQHVCHYLCMYMQHGQFGRTHGWSAEKILCKMRCCFLLPGPHGMTLKWTMHSWVPTIARWEFHSKQRTSTVLYYHAVLL